MKTVTRRSFLKQGAAGLVVVSGFDWIARLASAAPSAEVQDMTNFEYAYEKLTQRWMCSQVIVRRYAQREGWDLEQLMAISYPFHGGMIQGSRCGAVYGAYMVLGMYAHEWAEATGGGRWQLTSAMIEPFNHEFEEKNGSLVCRELLGHDLTTPEGLAAVFEENLNVEVCPKALESAMDIVDALVAENQPA